MNAQYLTASFKKSLDVSHQAHSAKDSSAQSFKAQAKRWSFSTQLLIASLLTVSSLASASHLQMMDDQEMGGVYAQGITTQVANELAMNSSTEIFAGLDKILPIDKVLSFETQMKGVQYSSTNPSKSIANGYVPINLPNRIQEVRIENIRVAGAEKNQSMFNVRMQDVQIVSNLRIKPHS